jgi:pimeloyl-ACP methyl ester carboxylesterase/DNA-binding CsgD family transcriptional regulator
MKPGQTSRQRIQYLTASDGVRLAWADVGDGPLLVKASNWLSHLEYDWDNPLWSHWTRFFAAHFRFVRSDERGCGMSEWNPGELSLDRWVDDLSAVVDAARPAGPVSLLGISQGAAICIAYAFRYPERVSHLVLHGAYARGSWKRGVLATEQQYRAMVELTRIGWGKPNPTFRQLFTSRFIPGGSDEQLRWFNDLCLKTTTGDIAARLFEVRATLDVTDLLAGVTAPTLILHARDDEITSIDEGRLLAAGIPGAEFVELDSRNHIVLEHEPAWTRFEQAVLEFLQVRPHGGADPAFAALSAREREILTLIIEGLSNVDIALRLGISDKTVRNHTSKLFDKLGVWTRAQAMVFARDRGFSS